MANDERLRWLMHIMARVREEDASDCDFNWVSAFCDDRGNKDDTFNIAIDRGLSRVSHDSDTDNSICWITDAGKAFAAANPPTPPNPPEKPDSSGSKQHCSSCGGITTTGECDCTRWGDTGTQKLRPEPDLREAVVQRMNDLIAGRDRVGAFEMADAAIAVVAAHLEAKAQALPMGHEAPSKGCSTYNWLMHAAREIRALVRKE